MAETQSERPLSPHLSIYRPQITTVLSILHRITGAALVFGLLGFAAWIWALAYSPECFAQWQAWLSSLFGQVMLIGWTAALYYHFCNGIRHLGWDMGLGFSLPASTRSGWLVVIATVLFTALTWMEVLRHGN